jgi:hypothetical protein
MRLISPADYAIVNLDFLMIPFKVIDAGFFLLENPLGFIARSNLVISPSRMAEFAFEGDGPI